MHLGLLAYEAPNTPILLAQSELPANKIPNQPILLAQSRLSTYKALN